MAGILAACGSSDATSTPKPGGATSAAPTSQSVVTIVTPTPQTGVATTASGSAPGGTTAAASITTMRPELKGSISLARQPNVPLSNGKPDPNTVIFGDR